MKSIIIYFLLFFIEKIISLKTANDFKSGLFKINTIASGVYQIDIGKLENDLLMAYGDFDGDKNTDIVTITSDNKINVNIWDTSTTKFKQFQINSNSEQCQGNIVNIIPSDYNYDGKLDLLIIRQQEDQLFCTDFLLQQECNILTSCSFILKSYEKQDLLRNLYAQPFVGDFLGDHTTQIFIMTKPDTKRYIISLDEETLIIKEFIELVQGDSSCLEYDGLNFLDNPHFSSIADFNGDCRADLILQTVSKDGKKQLEFWEKTKSDKYCLRAIQSFQSSEYEFYSFTLADINYDGSTDIVAFAKEISTQQSVIVISYNKNKVDVKQLCSQFSEFSFDEISQPGQYVQYQKLDFIFYTNQNIPFPRFSDIDLDGYPDMVLTKQQNIQNFNQGLPVILSNQKCTIGCENLLVGEKRMFNINNNKNYDSFKYVISHTTSFFDFNEDGRIDFIVNSFVNGKHQIKCYYDFVSTDAFFLKLLGLNGFCDNTQCQSSNYYGMTFEFVVTSLETNYYPAKGLQLSQSAHRTLQLPFVLIGLSRTNNYVENFHVGLPQANEDSIKVWTPIIPNSQLIVFPYTQKTSKWEISIFIQPNEALLIVVIVTIGILVILAVIIGWHHYKEQQDDIQTQAQFFKLFR